MSFGQVSKSNNRRRHRVQNLERNRRWRYEHREEYNEMLRMRYARKIRLTAENLEATKDDPQSLFAGEIRALIEHPLL